MFADAPSVPTIDAGRLGYMASQKDSAETETFWSHFLLRYEALAQTIAKGKS
jgi:hypothetical protein